jgi:hypothetical protein
MSCILTSKLNNERGEWLLVTDEPFEFKIKHAKFKISEKISIISKESIKHISEFDKENSKIVDM